MLVRRTNAADAHRDASHGQTGVAPNTIELHPVLQLCIGAGCTLD